MLTAKRAPYVFFGTSSSYPRAKPRFYEIDSSFDIIDGDIKIGQVVLFVSDQCGLVTLRHQDYTIGPASAEDRAGPYALLDSIGKQVATAYGQIDVQMTHEGQSYLFKREGFFKVEWTLFDKQTQRSIGSIAKAKVFGSTINICLPAGMNEVVQVFLFWLRLRIETRWNDPRNEGYDASD